MLMHAFSLYYNLYFGQLKRSSYYVAEEHKRFQRKFNTLLCKMTSEFNRARGRNFSPNNGDRLPLLSDSDEEAESVVLSKLNMYNLQYLYKVMIS